VLHSHEFDELVMILGGRGVHFTGKEEHWICAGDVFVVDEKRAHCYRHTKDLRLVNIMFDRARMQLPLLDVREVPGFHVLFTLEPRYRRQHRFMSRLRLSPEDLDVAEAMVHRLERECKGRRRGYVFAATAVFMELVAHLSRCYSQTQADSSLSLLRLGETLSYMEREYAGEVSLAGLCQIAQMSRNTLSGHFRKALGHSPIEYLIRLRITKAADLLRQGVLNVTQIAFRVGFSDSNYFSRQFRKVMGVSPRDFRRRSVP
jgi:AraC-like DNA-binding protein